MTIDTMADTEQYRVYTRTEGGSTGHEVIEAESKRRASEEALGVEEVVEVVEVEEYEVGEIDHPDLREGSGLTADW